MYIYTAHVHQYWKSRKSAKEKSHRINYFLNKKNRTVQLDNCFAIFFLNLFQVYSRGKNALIWCEEKKCFDNLMQRKKASIICFKVCAIWSFYLSNCHVILITSANPCNECFNFFFLSKWKLMKRIRIKTGLNLSWARERRFWAQLSRSIASIMFFHNLSTPGSSMWLYAK